MSTVAPRRPASAVPGIKGLVVSPPNAPATLVNISTSGLLADVGVSMKPGESATIKFEGTFVQPSVEAKVVRSVVAGIGSGGIRYHVAFAFKTPLVLDEEQAPAQQDVQQPAPAAAPPTTQAPPQDLPVNCW